MSSDLKGVQGLIEILHPSECEHDQALCDFYIRKLDELRDNIWTNIVNKGEIDPDNFGKASIVLHNEIYTDTIINIINQRIQK